MKQIIIGLNILLITSCGQSHETTNTKKTDATEAMPQNTQLPAEQALKFINSYVNNCNKMKESLGVIEWTNANGLTTINFKKELKTLVENAYKQDPELGLGFDPIFDAQDYPEKGFELVSFDEKTNFIVVKGKDWADFKLTLKMVEENEQWLVEGCGINNIPKDKQNFR